MTTLQSELKAFQTSFMAKVPSEIRDTMTRADLALAASGITDRALKTGDIAPDFGLPDATGTAVRLSDLLAKGPVVVSFYRGGWCPYCNLELRALQKALPEIAGLGATLLAISPEKPDETLTTAEKNELAFPVLSDHGSAVSKAFGIAFDLAEELRPIYTRFNHALPDRNGTQSWVLPIPATFVIAPNRRVALAFVDADYRKRLEPADILNALAGLAKTGQSQT
jgi:peroxiredoxin